MNEQHEVFAQWAIVELLGHRRLGAFVTEATLAGAGLLRLDVPETEHGGAVTQYINPSSLYALTPTTEAVARAVAARNRPEPVQRWELAPAIEAPRSTSRWGGHIDEDDPDDADPEPDNGPPPVSDLPFC